MPKISFTEEWLLKHHNNPIKYANSVAAHNFLCMHLRWKLHRIFRDWRARRIIKHAIRHIGKI